MNKYEEIRESEKHLLYTNKEIYNKIINYISTYKLQEDELIDIKMDILSIALNAQQRGESLSEVIENDPKRFCERIVAESKKKSTATKIKDTILNILLAIDIFIIIGILLNAIIDINNITVFTLGHLVFIIINTIVFKLLLYYLKKRSLDKDNNINKLGLLGLLLVILSAVLFVTFYNIKLFKPTMFQLIIIIVVTLIPQLISEVNRKLNRIER
ncbi:hypothetical protein PV797_10170 [Clostridiaceae bacterium M8S5]|nr:hypothetical protein PV797_10170 [Clostridiaceae bacterium M8S5]